MNSAKKRYFCNRCRRELLSKICPIHGIEHTKKIDHTRETAAPTTGHSGASQAYRQTAQQTVIQERPRPTLQQDPRPLPPARTEPLPQPPQQNSRPATNGHPNTNGHSRSGDSFTEEMSATNDNTIGGHTADDIFDTDLSFDDSLLDTPAAGTPTRANTQAQPATNPAPADDQSVYSRSAVGRQMVGRPRYGGGYYPDPEPVVRKAQPQQTGPNPATAPQPNSAPAQPQPQPQKSREKQSRSLRAMIESKLESLRPKPKPAAPKPRPAATPQPNVQHQQPQTNGHPQPRQTPRPQAASRPVVRRKRKSSKTRMIIMATIIPIALIYGAIAFSLYKPGANSILPDSFLPSAFSGDNSDAAANSIVAATDSSVDPEAIAAPAEISAGNQQQIASLMRSAQAAYERKRFLTPESDNAVKYLNQVLDLAPEHPAALNLQGEIVGYYNRSAKRALRSGKYPAAVQYYKNVLQVNPEDATVLDDIDKAIKAQKVSGMLNQLNELADTREELKELRKEKYRLKTEVNQQRRKLNRKPSSNNTRNSGGKPTGMISDRNTGSATSYVQNKVASSRVSRQDLASTSVVDESRIDGGKKSYEHIEVPKLPSHLKTDQMIMVLAECTVGTDGIVENIKVVSPAENEAYNALAVKTLRKYRFKPATMNGKPVKFKSVEVISF